MTLNTMTWIFYMLLISGLIYFNAPHYFIYTCVVLIAYDLVISYN